MNTNVVPSPLQLEHLVIRYSTDLLTVYTLDGTCVYASGAAMALVGVEPEVLLGRRLQDFVADDDRAGIDKEIPRLIDQEAGRLRYRIEAAGGTMRRVETRIRKSDPFLIASTREVDDSTEQPSAAWTQLRVEARTDWLTQLSNRRGLEESLQLEMDRYQRSGHVFSIAMLDVDRFKTVNDRYGHAAGDEILRRIAAFAGHGRRSYDVLGRWGGDEFLSILPETSAEEAAVVAERMVHAVAMEKLEVRDSGAITLSAGVASASGAPTIDALVEHADQAMYVAKSLGGNRVCRFYARNAAPAADAGA